jgi:wobble nucleotide-excising tRNase
VIKRIATINNIAVFQNFVWDIAVRNANGQTVDCDMLNIIYGRNYSGKTMLSRVVRALETGTLSEHFINAKYSVSFEDGSTVTEVEPRNHTHTIRVFNEDFVREHLGVFYNDDESVAAFAVLGKDNTEAIAKIEELENKLGDEETAGSLLAIATEAERNHKTASENYLVRSGILSQQLINQASAIKRGHRKYNEVIYDIRNIRNDIALVRANSYGSLTDEDVEKHEQTLQSTPKQQVPECPALDLQYESIVSTAEQILTKKIAPTKSIQELLNDNLLQEWVHKGRELHKGKRVTCGFCGNDLPSDLWTKLNNHFSQESELLRKDLEDLQSKLEKEIKHAELLFPVEPSNFYDSDSTVAQAIKTSRDQAVKWNVDELSLIRTLVQRRLKDIFTALKLPDIQDSPSALYAIRDRYEKMRVQTNEHTSTLSSKQKAASRALLLHRVHTFLDEIKYNHEDRRINRLKAVSDIKQKHRERAEKNATQIQNAIDELKRSMRDETIGAERVNMYLQHVFGHRALSLNPVHAEDKNKIPYRFEIMRGDKPAHHLSEGERSLIAFCYYMARLEDADTADTKPIVWIDDPISSLDENHIFFVYSLIRARVIESKLASQVFVSTHNLTFLKYLRRVGGGDNDKRQYFMVERTGDESRVTPMPKHIKEYATEFHYLFHAVHKFANAQNSDAADVCYGFANNLRRFLEMYLYFRFPDGQGEKLNKKLQRFFGDDNTAAAVVERVVNEYSHLKGTFERATVPIDMPCMQQSAQLVLKKIQEHDQAQFNALLRSIGEQPVAQ